MASFQQFSRRDWLTASAATMMGVSFSGWLPQLAQAASRSAKFRDESPKSCILLWMSGGPSQLDTFDPKPDHKNGGPVKAISTAVTGIQISESLPGIAKQMKDLAIIRDMNNARTSNVRRYV